jgi:cell division protein YceG involved in septum cleavage
VLASAPPACSLLRFSPARSAGPGRAAETAFMVERGATGASIAEALEEQRLINDDSLLFRIANRIYAPGATMQAGEYQIPPHASIATSSR